MWIHLCPALVWVDACYLRLPIGGLRNLITGSLSDDTYNSIGDCCSYVLSRSMLFYCTTSLCGIKRHGLRHAFLFCLYLFVFLVCLYLVCFAFYLFLLLVGIGRGDEGDGVLKGGLEGALLVLGVYLDLHGDTVLGAAVG